MLEEAGHKCTSTWAYGTREIKEDTVGPSPATEHDDLVRHVTGDLYDIARAGALISLTANFLWEQDAFAEGTEDRWLHTGGRHVELGYALSRRQHDYLFKIITVGKPENVFQRGLSTVVPNLPRAIQALG
jgi:hypothetical protein